MILLFQLGAGWGFQLTVREADVAFGYLKEETFLIKVKIKMNKTIHSINTHMRVEITLFSLPKWIYFEMVAV